MCRTKEQDIPIPEPRKRGRKRKTTNPDSTLPAAESASVLQDISNVAKSTTIETDKSAKSKVPRSIEVIIDDNRPEGPDAETTSPDPLNLPPTKKERTPEVSESILPTSKGPDKHSPIAKTSKVPYRVGLSRKARIAPLLKIVRK
jgi:hypothetical protein